MSEAPIVVCLGRYGDVVNALPLAYSLSQKGIKPKFCISADFWTILESVSYVQPIVWACDYKELPKAIERVKDREAYIMQAYMNPDRNRKTESYQTEAWRLAGKLDEFGKHPLVFDLRNDIEENALDLKACLQTTGYHAKAKTILVAGKSVSSPFKHDLVQDMKDAFPDCNVIDLCKVSGRKIQYLLGMMEKANCIVAVDTVHLHLANAMKTPLVALLNEGWFGSIPRQDAISFRYSQYDPKIVAAQVRTLIK